ncbi:hypothetical protein ABZ599_16435 [Streptomyces misionensis]|uniref:hypothetical protein n=1 Tax=Streptomyces misionensis TaxID=67331 RepID=UPI0033FB7DA0
MTVSQPHASSSWKVFALFAAAVLLAVAGILLLITFPGRQGSAEPPIATATSQGPSTTPRTAPAASKSALRHTAPLDQAPSASGFVPPEAADTARRFVVAWASHDASPGHDTSFSDAGRRAAVYATDELATQLRDPGSRSARLWQQWVADKTRMSCTVDRVAIPDGAPAATVTRVYVRVLYTCTNRSAGRPVTRSHEQLALEMHRDPSGAWRVGAIVNA